MKEDAIEKAEQIDPEIALWTGVKDVDLALAIDDWQDSDASSPISMKAELATLARHRTELGPL